MQEVFEKIIEGLDKSSDHYECEEQGREDVYMVDLEKAIEIVKEVAAEYNNGWISCSERLPEEPKPNPLFENKPLEFYIVTEKGATYPFRAFWNGKAFTDGWSKLDVIAWQPLPAPYKPKED